MFAATVGTEEQAQQFFQWMDTLRRGLTFTCDASKPDRKERFFKRFIDDMFAATVGKE